MSNTSQIRFPDSEKRFHILSAAYVLQYKTNLKWVCYDRLTDALGTGVTPLASIHSCQMDLEMMTSDIHQ